MFVLQEIYAAAVETPDKLAVAFNGRAISYGEFWRLIDARRRQLEPLTPENGTVLLATQHILEGWLLVLALRSLGLDTAVVRSAEEAALFEGTDVSGLITLDSEPHLELTPPAGARRLHLARLTDGPVSTAGPLGPQPNLRPPGGHILLTSGTTGRHKKIRSTSGEKPDQIRARRERYQALDGHRPTGDDTVSAIFNFGLWTAAGYAQPSPDGPRGYHGDPESTAAFFDETWFFGVLDGAGRLALHGRTTDIVHIGGDKHPVEPWERAIQERLECEGVCILSGRWGADDERLHVFIESRRPISAKALGEALRSTLFGFADVRVHRVDALPRTATGKVQRIDLARQLHEGAYQTSPA